MNKNKVFRWLPAFLLMTVIFLFSSIPTNSMPSFGLFDLFVKKGSHMLGYGLLATSYLFGIQKLNSNSQRLAVLLTILYALTDEWHQSYVPGRNGSLWDVGIDTLGAIFAVYLVMKTNLFSKFKF